MGPLARGDLRDTIERQLSESLAAGATLRCGGTRPEGRGYFFTPAVLTGCTAEMPAFREETFGPLAAVMRVASADEAISPPPTTPTSAWAATSGRATRSVESPWPGRCRVAACS